MTKFFKWIFWTFVILLVLSMAVGTLAIGTAFDGWQDSGHWHVVVDGQPVDDWVMDERLGLGGGLVAALVTGLTLVIVVPLVLIVGVGVPLLVLAVGLGAVFVALLGVSLVVTGPILIPVLLVVWLARRSRPKVAA